MSNLLAYSIVALGIGLTSYITIYRPAIHLYEEISERENSMQHGFIFQTFWIIAATMLAPLMAVLLMKGKNQEYIKDLVLYWVEQDEEDE